MAGLSFVEEGLQLLLAGRLLLLHQVSMALGDPPAVWSSHGGTLGAAGRWLQLLPVVTTGPGGVWRRAKQDKTLNILQAVEKQLALLTWWRSEEHTSELQSR